MTALASELLSPAALAAIAEHVASRPAPSPEQLERIRALLPAPATDRPDRTEADAA